VSLDRIEPDLRERATDLIVIGPLPPPLNGMTVMTEQVLGALAGEGLKVTHVDSSDHRHIGNVGKFDLQNAYLAIRHALNALLVIRRRPKTLVYMPLAQGILGFIRDVLFLGVAKVYECPVLVHFHGAEFGSFYRGLNRLAREIVTWCLSGTVGAIVLSEYAREDIETVRKWPKIHVIPNGIPSVDRPGGSRRAGSRVQILYLSKLSTRKGYADVLRAAPRVLRDFPECRFSFAGGWDNRSELRRAQAIVEELRIGEAIVFHGEVRGAQKLKLLDDADIFVFPPTRPEGQGLVLLEAMRSRLPVVATDIGNMADLVHHNVSGLLVRPNDPSALADALISLSRDGALRSRLGLAGFNVYRDRFTLERFQARLTESVRYHLGIDLQKVVRRNAVEVETIS
jgi:glycosyltransferase involved in cell wall biosynthesis